MYNLNRYNYKEKNKNNLYYINKYPNVKRTTSPQLINNQRRNNYYLNEANQNNKVLYKNRNINEEILNPQYQNNTNPINYMQQQNQKYSDYIAYYNRSNNIPIQNPNYYEQIMPQNNNYLYTDINIIPSIIPHNYQNNKIIHNDYINKNIDEQNKYKCDKYKNGVKLNITNYETQYPMTFLSANPYKKRNIFNQNNNTNNISHIKNIKESENNFQSKIMKKSKNSKNFNLTKIKTMTDLSGETDNISMKNKNKNKYNYKEHNAKNNINKKKNNEFFNKTTTNFHKKNKSLNEFHNILNEKHYAEDLNYENNINAKNNYFNNNLFKNTKKRMNCDAQLNQYEYQNNYINYDNQRQNLKNRNYKDSREKPPFRYHHRNIVNEYEEQEKYILKIKKFISHLEQYYIISFHNFFYFFLDQLYLYDQEKINNNKNSLLKRFQRTKNNNYSNFISNNFEPQYKNYINKINKEKYKYLNQNKSYLKKLRNVYIPKKNIEYMEINKKNHSINLGHHKNRSLEYIPYLTNQNYNNLSYTDNRINLNIDFNSQKNYKKNKKKDNSVDKIKNNRYSNKIMNKSHDNLVQNRLSPNSSTFHKNINDNMNKKTIIYIKPKASKLNLKKIIINKENDLNNINENSSFKYSNTINNINSNYFYNNIFNNKKKINENIAYCVKNNSFSLKNVEGLRSPNKSKLKDHIRNISDLAQEVMDNVNLNDNKINNEINENSNRFYYDNSDSENGINEIIGNEDLIEETIIKDICTYDKKLWVFIKYIISPKTKQNFLKIKRLRYIKSSKDKFLIKELNSLKSIHTDSIEIISPLSLLKSHKNNNIFLNNKKTAMKEISEEKESNDSNIQEENLNIKLSNMINILEEYKKQNFLFFYKFFFNLLNLQNNNNIDSLTQNQVFKNILQNFQNNNKNINNDENIYIDNKNTMDNNKNKELSKGNVFPDIYQENSYNYNYENDSSGNINIARKKLFDLNKNKESSKRSNSTEPSVVNHNNDKSEIKKKIEIKRKDKLNLIIMRKFKKHYFMIWNKKKNVKNIFKNNGENNNIEKKIFLLKNNLLKYILKKNKNDHKKEKVEEEEGEWEEEYEEEEDSLDK